MAKRFGFDPFILLTGEGGDDGGATVIGGGSGGGALNPFPMPYSDWTTSGFQVGYDFDGDGTFSKEEYAYWWDDRGFSYEDWIAQGNNDEEWAQYFGGGD